MKTSLLAASLLVLASCGDQAATTGSATGSASGKPSAKPSSATSSKPATSQIPKSGVSATPPASGAASSAPIAPGATTTEVIANIEGKEIKLTVAAVDDSGWKQSIRLSDKPYDCINGSEKSAFVFDVPLELLPGERGTATGYSYNTQIQTTFPEGAKPSFDIYYRNPWATTVSIDPFEIKKDGIVSGKIDSTFKSKDGKVISLKGAFAAKSCQTKMPHLDEFPTTSFEGSDTGTKFAAKSAFAFVRKDDDNGWKGVESVEIFDKPGKCEEINDLRKGTYFSLGSLTITAKTAPGTLVNGGANFVDVAKKTQHIQSHGAWFKVDAVDLPEGGGGSIKGSVVAGRYDTNKPEESGRFGGTLEVTVCKL